MKINRSNQGIFREETESLWQKLNMTSQHHCPQNAEDNLDQERIFVPAGERGRPVKSLMLSVRLRNVLAKKNISLAGELHGRSYAEFLKWQNCGRTTLAEFRELVRKLQSGTNEETHALRLPIPVSGFMRRFQSFDSGGNRNPMENLRGVVEIATRSG